MAYMAGYASGSLFLPPLSDKKGRKKFLIGALCSQITAVFLMLALPKGYAVMIIACFFLIGCCSAIRVPTAFCLMYDSAPKRYHSTMNSIFFVVEISTLAV